MKIITYQRQRYTAAFHAQSGILQSLIPDGGSTNLMDEKRPFGSLCYTSFSDNLAAGPKPEMTPWQDKEMMWDHVIPDDQQLTLDNSMANVAYSLLEDRIHIRFVPKQNGHSQIGLNMPFHFLGKKGGDYRTQLIPNSPYHSKARGIHYWFMDSPEGQKLLVAAKGAAAWKLDYSEYICGHFFLNLKWLLQLDKIYGALPSAPSMELDIFFPSSFQDAMEILASQYDIPVALADHYCPAANQPLSIRISGNATHCVILREEQEIASADVKDGIAQIVLPEPGIYQVVPMNGSVRGLECVIGVTAPYQELLYKNMQALQAPYHCDRGICEGGVWAQAAILHQRMLGQDAFVQSKIDEQLRDILTGKIPRCSVRSEETDGWPAYHVYGFLRTQEAFFGVALFTEAYRTYRNPVYLEYAVGMMDCLQEHYILPNGEIVRRHSFGSPECIDYTTVTAPLLAVVDLVRVLREEKHPKAEEYANLAVKIADYLVDRGFSFPTEGGIVELTEPEMEDGSIACSALSVLYVAYWIKKKPAYLEFAEKVLRLHDSWCMKSPDVRMYGSSLRWWETLWEGDEDGPAICAGHAWSLWRAEADFYYGLLTGNVDAFLKSYNGFATNLIKIQPDGTSRACYHPDVIPGGGFHETADTVDHRLKGGYPEKADQSLSKYLWVRLENTWWNTCVVYERNGEPVALNGRIQRVTEQEILLEETVTPIKRIINLTDRKAVCR